MRESKERGNASGNANVPKKSHFSTRIGQALRVNAVKTDALRADFYLDSMLRYSVG